MGASTKLDFIARATRPEIRLVTDLPDDYPDAYVRSMNVSQRGILLGDKNLLSGEITASQLLPHQIDAVMWCLCEEDGTRFFPDASAEDKKKVEEMSAEAVDAISLQAFDVSGLSSSDEDEDEGEGDDDAK